MTGPGQGARARIIFEPGSGPYDRTILSGPELGLGTGTGLGLVTGEGLGPGPGPGLRPEPEPRLLTEQ